MGHSVIAYLALANNCWHANPSYSALHYLCHLFIASTPNGFSRQWPEAKWGEQEREPATERGKERALAGVLSLSQRKVRHSLCVLRRRSTGPKFLTAILYIDFLLLVDSGDFFPTPYFNNEPWALSAFVSGFRDIKVKGCLIRNNFTCMGMYFQISWILGSTRENISKFFQLTLWKIGCHRYLRTFPSCWVERSNAIFSPQAFTSNLLILIAVV